MRRILCTLLLLLFSLAVMACYSKKTDIPKNEIPLPKEGPKAGPGGGGKDAGGSKSTEKAI